jgi:addiction module HigA family antidote
MTDAMNQYLPDRVSPPGDTLLETIEALGMTQADLATRLGRPKKTVNEIIQAKAAITPETALQLEAVLGVPAGFWMNREARYRESLARYQRGKELAAAHTWTKRFPVRAMIKAGWIEECATTAEMAQALFQFFGVASVESWGSMWERLEVSFRRSAKHRGDRCAIAAWLRKGEIDGGAIECAPYQAQRFRDALQEARSLTRKPPEEFQPTLTALFAACGVAIAWIRELPDAPISGATRWLTPEKALLQVSLRYKTDDQLWFSIFHEAAHILKHPRRATFIEDGSRDTPEEREADDFAASSLIPSERLQVLARQSPVSCTEIEQFARTVGIAPGIVVGRLQHDGVIDYSHCNKLKRRLSWVDED